MRMKFKTKIFTQFNESVKNVLKIKKLPKSSKT